MLRTPSRQLELVSPCPGAVGWKPAEPDEALIHVQVPVYAGHLALAGLAVLHQLQSRADTPEAQAFVLGTQQTPANSPLVAPVGGVVLTSLHQPPNVLLQTCPPKALGTEGGKLSKSPPKLAIHIFIEPIQGSAL